MQRARSKEQCICRLRKETQIVNINIIVRGQQIRNISITDPQYKYQPKLNQTKHVSSLPAKRHEIRYDSRSSIQYKIMISV